MSNQQPEPGKPMPPTTPPPTAEQVAQHQRLMAMLTALDAAAGDIGSAFADGDSGSDFAEVVIKYKRRPQYDLIRSLGQTGPDMFDLGTFVNSIRTLLTHPQRTPAIAKLAADVLDKPTFGQFLAEFFNYDAIREAMQKQAEDEENQR
jgi:hypothetical protein